MEKIKYPIGEYDVRGFVTIEYKDPITGRVIEQIKGENHIYADSLFGGELQTASNASGNWVNDMSNVYLIATDDDREMDPNFPYITGIMRGFGIPNTVSFGEYRGGYVASDSFLAKQTRNNISFKYVYDFGINAGLGQINTIGLTHQYRNARRTHPSRMIVVPAMPANPYEVISDGKYMYEIADTGILTRTDLISGDIYTIDLSLIVGAVSADRKSVGYNDILKHYYIYVGSTTTANRKLYEFDNNLFIGTPVILDFPLSTSNYKASFFVYNNVIYRPQNVIISNAIYLFVKSQHDMADINISGPSFTEFPSVGVAQGITYNGFGNYRAHGKFMRGSMMCIPSFFSSTSLQGCGFIYDLSKELLVGELVKTQQGTLGGGVFLEHPVAKNFLPCIDNEYNNCAVAQFKYQDDAPQRPEGHPMTIIYEIQVKF